MTAQYDALEAQKKNPFPTPPVPYLVTWYENNDQRNPRAAIVTQVEEPGRLRLTVFPPNGRERHIQGCWHVSHECHRNRGSNQTVQSGSWDYPNGEKPPKGHYAAHIEQIERRQDSILEQMRKDEEAKAAREKLKDAVTV